MSRPRGPRSRGESRTPQPSLARSAPPMDRGSTAGSLHHPLSETTPGIEVDDEPQRTVLDMPLPWGTRADVGPVDEEDPSGSHRFNRRRFGTGDVESGDFDSGDMNSEDLDAGAARTNSWAAFAHHDPSEDSVAGAEAPVSSDAFEDASAELTVMGSLPVLEEPRSAHAGASLRTDRTMEMPTPIEPGYEATRVSALPEALLEEIAGPKRLLTPEPHLNDAPPGSSKEEVEGPPRRLERAPLGRQPEHAPASPAILRPVNRVSGRRMPEAARLAPPTDSETQTASSRSAASGEMGALGCGPSDRPTEGSLANATARSDATSSHPSPDPPDPPGPPGPPGPPDRDVWPSKLLPARAEGKAKTRRGRTRDSTPAEGPDLDDIHRWSVATDVASKTLPLLIAAFVLVATVVFSIMIFGGRSGAERHVRLQFLNLAGQHSSASSGDKRPTRLHVSTEPPGVLVVLGQEILGRTPFEAEIPLKLEDQVGVELSSPYFETWVGQIQRDLSGAFTVYATLVKK